MSSFSHSGRPAVPCLATGAIEHQRPKEVRVGTFARGKAALLGVLLLAPPVHARNRPIDVLDASGLQVLTPPADPEQRARALEEQLHDAGFGEFVPALAGPLRRVGDQLEHGGRISTQGGPGAHFALALSDPLSAAARGLSGREILRLEERGDDEQAVSVTLRVPGATLGVDMRRALAPSSVRVLDGILHGQVTVTPERMPQDGVDLFDPADALRRAVAHAFQLEDVDQAARQSQHAPQQAHLLISSRIPRARIRLFSPGGQQRFTQARFNIARARGGGFAIRAE